jgi:hypothetical protein
MRNDDDTNMTSQDHSGTAAADALTIEQTPTGYWTVQREGRHLAGSMTRRGAEAERDLMLRLSRRSVRRTTTRRPASV